MGSRLSCPHGALDPVDHLDGPHMKLILIFTFGLCFVLYGFSVDV